MTEEKSTKPKVTLEEIAGSAAKFIQSSELSKQNDYASQLQNFYSYIKSIGGNPQEIQGMYNYGQDPEKFSVDVAAAAAIDKKKSLASVESGLDLIVAKLDEDSLTAFAVKVGLKDKKYQTLIKAMETKDKQTIVSTVRADYLERNKDNEYVTAWAKTARPDTWLSYSGFEISRMQEDFAKKNLYSTIEKDGKKEAQYDSKKAQEYLLKSIRALKDKEKAKKEKAKKEKEEKAKKEAK